MKKNKKTESILLKKLNSILINFINLINQKKKSKINFSLTINGKIRFSSTYIQYIQ